jgi:hypothetical protein
MRSTEREKWDVRHKAGTILGAIYAKIEGQRRRELSDTMLAAAARADSVPAWFSHVCGRFGVHLEECAFAGRERIDATMATIKWSVLREAVEENPALLTIIAKEGPLPEDLAPLEEQAETRRPWVAPLPTGDLIPVNAMRTILTSQSSMIHGADDRRGNVILFRREEVVDLLTGEIVRCPFISGNSIRHSLRRLAAEHLYGFVGIRDGQVDPELHHALTSGGVIDAGSDMAKVDPVVRRAIRELFPAFELFGGIPEKQVCHGAWSVHDATMVCRENASRLMHQGLFPAPPALQELAAKAADPNADEPSRRDARIAYLKALTESLRPALSFMQMRQYTKHIDPDVPSTADTMHAMWDTEIAIAGSQWLHFVTVDPTASEAARSAAGFILGLFAKHPYLAASNGKGHGLVAFSPYQGEALPGPDLYLSQLEARKQEIADWLTSGKVTRPTQENAPVGKRARR